MEVNEPLPRRSESRGITTAAMLLLAAGVGLLGLESCTQAPEAKTKEPVVTDVKKDPATDVKVTPEVKPVADPPKDPEPMPPPAT